MELIETIRKISQKVAERNIDRLRIEEELLILVATNNNHSLETKRTALERVKTINKQQIELLGGF